MNKFFKRLFDIIASASGLIILSPVFLILVYLIRKNLGSPVFFIQERPGKDGRPFKMIKFRSMRDAIDKDGNPLPDSERLTDFGKKLRAASLDELPELWNVLKGDMSLVGPRPLLMQYLPLYDNFQNRRHEMKPGITGWAQVNGRNALSWDEKFACDVWYIDHYSFWLDMKILFLTVKKVLIKEGISAEGEATMPYFTGNQTNEKNNILILSAGRRVELVQDFQTEAARFSDGISVFATDLNPRMSSACHVSDGSFEVPPISADSYIDSIFNLAVRENIGLIIPTIDTELQKLADERERFEAASVHIVVSDSDFIAQCRDKRKTATLFARYGIRSPEIYDRKKLVFPCFDKPYDGSRAIGAKRIDTPADLTPEVLADTKLMFCQFIDIENKFSEFTVDMYYDRQCRLKCAIPRKRLEVRSGEISKGVTCKNSLYQTLLEKMSVLQGARGCITAQFFYNEETGEFYGVEINPRFGGGFPLTYAAGGNYPSRLMREYLGDEEIPFSDDWENNLIMLRYDAKVLVHEND